MKGLLILFLILFSFGCAEINTLDKETYTSLEAGIEMLDSDLLEKYINNDSSLSTRDKNSKMIKIKAAKEAFKSLKIQK